MPCMTSGRTRVGVMTGVKPAATAVSIAALSSASSRRAPTPVR
ncbi:Uncharacterised protein [Mycobacteroides abscessus]|nr:Uncharacterised protein [Mycobacteroides abscessus]